MAPLEFDSTIILSLAFLVSCLVVVISFWSGRKNGLPPSPRSLPIIGNLHQLRGGHHHRTLEVLAQRHGPLFFLRLGSVPAIVVSSASVAEAVFKTQDHVFCSRPPHYTALGTLYGCRDIAFSPYGDQWRQSRRIAVVHLLSTKRVDSFRALRLQEVAGFVQQIRAACGAGEDRGVVNVSELTVNLTNTVVSKAAFGSKLGGVEPVIIRDMMKELTEVLDLFAVSDLFPRLRWVDWATGLDARVKKTAAKLDGILEGAITEHENSLGDGDGEVRDLMDDLLSILNDGDRGFKLDRIDIKALILDMFLAGVDTTYKTIEWTMAQLVKNPRELAKVQSVVRQIVGGTDEEVIEVDVEKMSLLHAAIREGLRLTPTIIERETIQDTRLLGYHIPAKTAVPINAWAIGGDAELWDNAEEFRPERFLGKAIDYTGKDTKFIPFGAGGGMPGVGFAMRLVELALANMMYHFDWELPDGQDLESFQVIEADGLSLGLESALLLGVKPCKKSRTVVE
ncbi:cytochrome P450 71A1-like [Lolium rigidum]|uniref:cytochrome P450 71A1-like n=1 Tax=Lolium rigidum TaxID=89674 RepID=UPI001F5E1584|nr:cytochrome P450 71A1-like [Lolium rigidum]